MRLPPIKHNHSSYIMKCISVRPTVPNERIFASFFDEADELAKSIPPIPTLAYTLSKTENMILSKKLTDQEIILLQFFIKNETPILNDYSDYDYSTKTYIEAEDLIAIKDYEETFSNFSYQKAKTLLEKSNYLTFNYKSDINGNYDYLGCELSIEFFRELISLSSQGQKYIDNILNKHKKVNRKYDTKNSLDNYVLSQKLTEYEALLLAYMYDTKDVALGDRWMESETISRIEKWENEQNIKNHKLSQNYSSTLFALVNKGYLEASSYTAYGNPRQYRLKRIFIDDIFNLRYKAKQVLYEAKRSNIISDDLPF